VKLYELALEHRRIDAAISEAQGEVTPEVEAMLDSISGAVEEKVDGICALIREREANAGAIKAEEMRLAALRRADEAAAERLKGYLLRNLQSLGLDHANGRRFRATVTRAGRPSIRWDGAGEPPEGFRRVRVEPDLAAAQQAHDAGMLPLGFVATFNTSLRIR
jgi:hypothetical protein